MSFAYFCDPLLVRCPGPTFLVVLAWIDGAIRTLFYYFSFNVFSTITAFQQTVVPDLFKLSLVSLSLIIKIFFSKIQNYKKLKQIKKEKEKKDTIGESNSKWNAANGRKAKGVTTRTTSTKENEVPLGKC